MNLFLFDIDGTLINVNAIHVKTWQQLLQERAGISVTEKKVLSKFGRSGRQITREISEEYGVDIEAAPFMNVYKKRFASLLDTVDVKPLSGVIDFLQQLKRRKETLGIITGNNKENGELLLRKAKLFDFFSVFGWGTNAASREEIVQRAMNDAKDEFEKVIVIGDTELDIEAGKTVGDLVVGIATGHVAKKDLREADLVLDNLKEWKRILEAVDSL